MPPINANATAKCAPPAAPLVPAAAALTIGIFADRVWNVPSGAVAAVLGLGLLVVLAGSRRPRISALGLGLAIAAIGAWRHHQFCDAGAPDSIARLAADEPRLVRVRGVLVDAPQLRLGRRFDPLRSAPELDRTRARLDVVSVADGDDWRGASGRATLIVDGEAPFLRAGDLVELVGWLSAPARPSNPGEHDAAAQARDDGIAAILRVRKTAEGILPIGEGHAGRLAQEISAIRASALRILNAYLPTDDAATASALLIGDGSAMTAEEWAIYVRTGVVHALVISGQHLVVLAAFLWLVLRIARVPRRWGAVFVALALVAYALLTGANPPALRSAVQVAAVCGAIVLQRTAFPANTLALAWIVVLLVRPTDIGDAGFLLSFLCVALLIWCVGPLLARKTADPLERMVAVYRPAWRRGLIWLTRAVLAAYAASFILGVAVMPLTAWRYHLISWAGIVIGPPVVALTSVALISGFLLFLGAAIAAEAAAPFAAITAGTLTATRRLVTWTADWPGGFRYVGDVPLWWLIGTYAALFALLLVPALRKRWRWAAITACAWFLIGIIPIDSRRLDDGLRMTFLAVGHGGSAVIEAPDGRVALYDAGAMSGPEVTQRIIAPYLWHRRIRQIDDVILSHADLDHFNGLPALLERFPVGRVLVTPSFAEKPTPGVREALRAIDAARVRLTVIKAGDRLTAGPMTLDVLHPPAAGPPGIENVRSLVLRLRHAGHSILLTGDLQDAGLDALLGQPGEPTDVLQAPHHGSRSSNTPALASWSRPAVVVACNGPAVWPTRVPEMYAAHGARYFGTWPHGAVTVISRADGLRIETFRTGERMTITRMGVSAHHGGEARRNSP